MTDEEMKVIERLIVRVKANNTGRNAQLPNGNTATAWPDRSDSRRIHWRVCDATGVCVDKGVYTYKSG